MINGICQVLFKTISGEKAQVNMDKYSFAHLVADFKKKKASVFKESFTYGDIEYSGFGLLARNDHGKHRNFTLEFSVN